MVNIDIFSDREGEGVLNQFLDLSEEDFEEENISNRNEKRKSIELSESEVSQEDEKEICFTKGMACKTQGTSQSKMHIQRTCEDPFVEADEKHALCFFKLKVKSFKFIFYNYEIVWK